MKIDILLQAEAMGLALAVGAGLGLFYNLLRPVRRRTGKLGAALLDMFFCALSGTTAFIYAMGAGDGRMGICQLGAMTAGFILYLYILSDRLSRALRSRTGKKKKT